jgi:four helix bundle protein
MQNRFDIHDRLLLLACDIVRTTQFLHTLHPIARALSYQLLNAGISIGANAQEADGASSTNSFIAKFRIALKEAKETHFRLRVCPRLRLPRSAFRFDNRGVGSPRSDHRNHRAQRGAAQSTGAGKNLPVSPPARPVTAARVLGH